ncbi:hypothetical protein ACQ86N_16840 [Puia sp. P3]|uniref:hypothetical protein n=1 Tax=Puia sp. P3 TaxID=3423952 RepID=UPI003D678194
MDQNLVLLPESDLFSLTFVMLLCQQWLNPKTLLQMNTPTLFDKLCSVDHLLFSWKNLNRTNPDSFGLSGESISEFEANLATNLESMSQQLRTGKYRFSETRPYLIKKDNGKFRPLQIPEISDRLVLKAIAIILEGHLQKVLLPGNGISFAYQKGKGIQDALSSITRHYDSGNRFVYEADIVDFFGTVDRLRIVDRVCQELPDKSLNSLIEEGIKPRIGDRRRFLLINIIFSKTMAEFRKGIRYPPFFQCISISVR